MLRIPAVSYNKYFKVYQPKRTDMVNNMIPETYQMEISRGALQVLTKLSVNNIKYQQDMYRQQVVDFNSQAKDLNAAAKSVAASDFFDQKQVAANNRAITGQARNTAKVAQYDVTVSQLATAQKNTGTSVARSAFGGLNAGVYALGITVGSGTEKPVFVHIGTAENNSQLLGRFAKAINEAETGVKAEVKTAGTQSYLSLESEKTGQTNSFSIRDITGTAAQTLNLGNQVTAATDTVYSVNGQSMATDQNKLSLDDGNVVLNSNAVTTGSAKVSVRPDTETMAAGIGTLLEKYNAFSGQLSGASNATRRGEKALAGVETMLTRARKNDFQSIGISWDQKSNQVQLDQEKLTQALQQNPDKVEALFSGSAGLAALVQNITQTALANPVSSYLKEPDLMDSIDYGWRRSGNRFLYNGFNSVNQGLFLDMIV